MKYTIEGFSQEIAIRIGLDVKDLVFLRWLLDFYNTGKMEFHIFEGRQYFWVNYPYVIAQLPIIGVNSKDALARRLRGISKCGLLHHKLFEGAGNRTYFRFDEKALAELISSDTSTEVVHDPNEGGSDPKVGRATTQKSEGLRPKSRNQYDSSIIDSSIKDKDIAFEEVWNEYPEKVGRKEAQKHFEATVKNAKDYENIKTALKNYKDSDRVKKKFIQNGSTWFNNWPDWIDKKSGKEPPWYEKLPPRKPDCRLCADPGMKGWVYLAKVGKNVPCSCRDIDFKKRYQLE